MSFTITDENGNVTEEVWYCTQCSYTSTKRHFHDGPNCVMCNAPAKKAETISKSTGMSDFYYRELLTHLLEEVSGVGQGTVDAIDAHFDENDAILDAAEQAYQEAEYYLLTQIDGIGAGTAESIALGLAEKEGWENGKAEMKFNI